MDRIGALGPASEDPWRAKRGDLFGFFKIFVSKHHKNGGEPLEVIKIFSKKVSQCRKNCKGGPFEIFQHPFCRKTFKQLKGDPFVKKKIETKSHSAEKNGRGALWSRPELCYTEKKNNVFG